MRGAGVGILVLGLCAGLVLGSRDRTIPYQQPSSAPVSSVDGSAELSVHVAGWVVSPGVVTVAEGAIVADAVAAAGGLRSGARSDLLNLAATIAHGEQVVVPGPGEDVPAAVLDGLIAINSATAADLEGLPGVGPVLAERIEAFRATNGPFSEVEDLLQVPGIGEAKLASMRDLIRVP